MRLDFVSRDSLFQKRVLLLKLGNNLVFHHAVTRSAVFTRHFWLSCPLQGHASQLVSSLLPEHVVFPLLPLFEFKQGLHLQFFPLQFLQERLLYGHLMLENLDYLLVGSPLFLQTLHFDHSSLDEKRLVLDECFELHVDELVLLLESLSHLLFESQLRQHCFESALHIHQHLVLLQGLLPDLPD